MATPTWIKDLLRGGVPAIVDGLSGGSDDVTNPERIPPSDQTQLERANPNGSGFMSLTTEQVLTFTALAVGAIFVTNMLKKS